jgi:hypothetical protein
MDKATFKEALIVYTYTMTYAVVRPTKDQVEKAIGDTLQDNKKLYKLLEQYDENAKTKVSKAA